METLYHAARRCADVGRSMRLQRPLQDGRAVPVLGLGYIDWMRLWHQSDSADLSPRNEEIHHGVVTGLGIGNSDEPHASRVEGVIPQLSNEDVIRRGGVGFLGADHHPESVVVPLSINEDHDGRHCGFGHGAHCSGGPIQWVNRDKEEGKMTKVPSGCGQSEKNRQLATASSPGI